MGNCIRIIQEIYGTFWTLEEVVFLRSDDGCEAGEEEQSDGQAPDRAGRAAHPQRHIAAARCCRHRLPGTPIAIHLSSRFRHCFKRKRNIYICMFKSLKTSLCGRRKKMTFKQVHIWFVRSSRDNAISRQGQCLLRSCTRFFSFVFNRLNKCHYLTAIRPGVGVT